MDKFIEIFKSGIDVTIITVKDIIYIFCRNQRPQTDCRNENCVASRRRTAKAEFYGGSKAIFRCKRMRVFASDVTRIDVNVQNNEGECKSRNRESVKGETKSWNAGSTSSRSILSPKVTPSCMQWKRYVTFDGNCHPSSITNRPWIL